MARSDQHHSAQAVGNQIGAPQNKSPQEYLAQLGIGLNNLPESRPVELQDFARHRRSPANQRLASQEHIQFAREFARLMRDDRNLHAPGRADDLNAAFNQHEEMLDGRAHLDQNLPGCGPSPPPKRSQALNLRGIKLGKRLVTTIVDLRHAGLCWTGYRFERNYGAAVSRQYGGSSGFVSLRISTIDRRSSRVSRANTCRWSFPVSTS